MRTTRAAAIVAVLAGIGLVVSVAAAWPRPAPPNPLQEARPGSPVSTGPAREFAPQASAAAERTRKSPSPSTGQDPVTNGRRDGRGGTSGAEKVPRPAAVSVPAIDYTAPVRPVGVTRTGQMQLPPRPSVLGWYRFGPAPTQPGSVVVAGHIDSRRFGLGPLVRLRRVEVGDAVRVRTMGGVTLRYDVISIDRYDRQALPARLFGRAGPERLRLITCGGDYDADAGGYQQNLVVTARPR